MKKYILPFLIITLFVVYLPQAQAKSFDGQLCPQEQQLTQNLKTGGYNGRYNGYTHGIVKEAHILQSHLNRIGFASGKIDGMLGPVSDGAIKRIQIFLGVRPDGYVGPITRNALNHSCRTVKSKNFVVKKYGDFNSDDEITLEVQGEEVYVNNVISDDALILFKKMLRENPQVKTVVEVDMPGSENDIVMIDLAYYIRSKQLNTKLLSYSEIHSGAVDVFLAGVERSMEYGAVLGVHSWGDEDGTEATDYPEDSPEHDANANYIEDMLGSDSFYWFTIYAAEADDIHEMTLSEIKKYGLLTKEIQKPKNPTCVYNHAYQENYKNDSIADILKNAEGCYVLVDPLMNNAEQYIPQIKSKGNQVGCYMSAGTGENWRDDFDVLKAYLAKKMWGDWDGEYFVSQAGTPLKNIMKKRIKKFAEFGCDWVEFDNMDWAGDDDYRDEYDLDITQNESEDYVRELCTHTKSLDMKCMAKSTNYGDALFDGITLESYSDEKDWWNHDEFKMVLENNKLGIIVHYNENKCDDVYGDYKEDYGNKLSFICEDKNMKKYKHYNN